MWYAVLNIQGVFAPFLCAAYIDEQFATAPAAIVRGRWVAHLRTTLLSLQVGDR